MLFLMLSVQIPDIRLHPPEPFSPRVEAEAQVIGKQVSVEFTRCGDARTYSNGRYVEAMGAPAHSQPWKIAEAALYIRLTVCEDERAAFQKRRDFYEHIMSHGSPHDTALAKSKVGEANGDIDTFDMFYAQDVPKYHELLKYGRGLNRDGTDPNEN